MEYLKRQFLDRTETLYGCCTYHRIPCYVHCDISMATQWMVGLLHPKSKIRVSLLKEVLFALDVHSVGVHKGRHYTVQAQESLLWEGRGLRRSVLLW